MITRLTSIPELKSLFVETLLNKTNKVTKVSDESILGGIAYGNAKIAQKAMKDIALVESHLFPDNAYGSDLDIVATRLGISPRFQASQSTTYVRIVADPGTTYTAGLHVFSANGQAFDLEHDTVVPEQGFTYASVRSQSTGIKTNVEPLMIKSVNPIPNGHKYVINEYHATYGRDIEDDHLFRLRIKEGANLAARNTIAYYTQVLQKTNNNVLRAIYQGINEVGRPVLAIVTQNGSSLTSDELQAISDRAQEFISLSEINPFNQYDSFIEFTNAQYQPQDFAFRVLLNDESQSESTRIDIQIAFNKELDLRKWKQGARLEWDNFLQIVKDHPNVRYVPDIYFSPNQDVEIPFDKLPRVRAFIMMDMNGNVISQTGSYLNPIYYPSDIDLPYQSTILAGL